MSARITRNTGLSAARAATRRALEVGRTQVAWVASRRGSADLAVFHDFVAGPWGGGNQFLRALVGELDRRGLVVEVNRVSRGTKACLVNSFNFDSTRLRRFVRDDVRVVHRVDGPIGRYRGFDDGTDAVIAEINRNLADATIVQSRYSLDAHRELGIDLVAPTLVPNAVDPAIFHPPEPAREPISRRRVRVIATSWSDNENKGFDVLSWLDANLDRDRFELTFVGRTPARFENVRALGALPLDQLAAELRRSDIYLAASQNDPCSNALLEALACGLPAIFRASGGHPELVGDGGVPFHDPDELPAALDTLLAELDDRRSAIRITPLRDVADSYLGVLDG
jgi:glycosyltransferase involved in cell wall biosynthesis